MFTKTSLKEDLLFLSVQLLLKPERLLGCYQQLVR